MFYVWFSFLFFQIFLLLFYVLLLVISSRSVVCLVWVLVLGFCVFLRQGLSM
jgi:hypothetical protein